MSRKVYRRYDPRLKNLVAKSNDISHFYKLGIPKKSEILAAITDAASVVSLKICLEAIGLTAARYRSWLKRQVACLLKDLPSCPRMSPTQLVRSEVEKIRELFTSKNFSHYSVQSLSWLGKKTGHVIASPSTWSINCSNNKGRVPWHD